MSRSFSAARARNEGFAALVACRPNVRFVQFVDGDCELVAGWLDTALAFLKQRADVALVCGRRREQHPETSIYNKLCDIEWDTPVGEATVCGGDTMIRTEAFKAVGGFRAQLIAGEEPELCLRLRENGWKIWRLDAEMTRHDAAITRFSQWWVRTVRSGYAYAEVSRLHKHSKFRIFAENVRRAVVWAGIIPMAIFFGMLFHPAAAVGILIYPLQVLRHGISARLCPISILEECLLHDAWKISRTSRHPEVSSKTAAWSIYSANRIQIRGSIHGIPELPNATTQ